jgi:hypothetical protein
MIENFKEEDVDESKISVLEDDLGKIKTMKNKYQDDIEDFIEKYMDSAPAAEIKELQTWEAEVTDIGNTVKEHAKKIRNRKEELFPSPKPVYYKETNHSHIFISERNLEVQEKIVKVQRQIVEGKLEEASLFPDNFKGKNSLDLKVMDLKLQEHTLQEMQEVVQAKQEGRQPYLFLEDTDMLISECNSLCERIQKAHVNVQTVIFSS